MNRLFERRHSLKTVEKFRKGKREEGSAFVELVQAARVDEMAVG
jgi:hypothetical protein